MSSAVSPSGRRGGKGIWLVATIVATLVVAGLPLLWYLRYYYVGDTQNGAFPQWYYYGRELLSGHWPVVNLWGWRGGDNVAEGQIGLLSPVQMLISLAAVPVTNAVVFVTAVKAIAAVVAATGAYLLARSYDLARPLAFVVGSTIVLGGEMQYLDSPSWVTGMFVFALLPWAWWTIRRVMIHDANPLPAFIAGGLIITIGYVFGTMYLILVFLACLLDAWRLHGKLSTLRVFGLGVLAGLTALAVYLPGVLTTSVTQRANQGIGNDNNLPIQVAHYAVSMIPTGIIPQTVGSMNTRPLGYIAWFLPLLAWVDPTRLKTALRPLAGLFLMAFAVVCWTLGPSIAGPLRFPARVMPIVVLTVVLMTVALLTSTVGRPSRTRLWASLFVVLFGTWVTASRFVPLAKEQFVGGALVALGVVVTWLLWRRGSDSRGATRSTTALAVASVFIVAWSVGMQAYQHHVFPRPPSFDRNTTADPDQVPKILAGAKGDVLVLGTYEKYLVDHKSPSSDVVIGASWYLTDRPVANTYTTISFRKYQTTYCMDHLGQTCSKSLATLLSTEATTGKPRLDLLSTSTVLIWKATFPPSQYAAPPVGWHVAKDDPEVVMWVRDTPVGTAGGVVATSSGTQVTTLTQQPRTVRFRVDSVGADGGTVTMSRIPWPGYAAAGASLADPVDGYLLTVHVPAGSAGKTVTVTFTPPGWRAGIGSLVGALLLALAWTLAHVLRRRRRGSVAADEVAGAADEDDAAAGRRPVASGTVGERA